RDRGIRTARRQRHGHRVRGKSASDRQDSALAPRDTDRTFIAFHFRETTMSAAHDRVHTVDEILPAGPMFAVGLQHVLVMYAGVFTVLVAPWFGKMVRFFPPIVTGTIIAVIGITLLRVGVTWAGGGAGNKNFGAPEYLAIVAAVLAVILLLNKVARGFVANIAVLIGLAVGFGVAITAGMVTFAGVTESDWFAFVYPFRFGTPTFDISAVVSLCIVMIVVMVDSTGMFLALGEICDKKV